MLIIKCACGMVWRITYKGIHPEDALQLVAIDGLACRHCGDALMPSMQEEEA